MNGELSCSTSCLVYLPVHIERHSPVFNCVGGWICISPCCTQGGAPGGGGGGGGGGEEVRGFCQATPTVVTALNERSKMASRKKSRITDSEDQVAIRNVAMLMQLFE